MAACAASTPARRGAGVQRHQHTRQGAGPGPACRGLPERQNTWKMATCSTGAMPAAARLLEPQRQIGGKLASGAHVLPHQRPHRAAADDQPVRSISRRRASPACTARERNPARRRAQTLKDYGHAKNAVWGVTTRNREQNFAINLLMDPEVDFVTLAGAAPARP